MRHLFQRIKKMGPNMVLSGMSVFLLLMFITVGVILLWADKL